jgi:hypothetical protein
MSDLDFITCPDCGKKIPINEALTHQIKEQFDSELKEKLAALNKEKEELSKSLETREKDLQNKLKAREEELAEKMRQDLIDQRKKLKEELTKEAKAQVDLEFEDLKKQNEENQKKLVDARKLEIDLRNERRNLEDQKKNMELDLNRRLDEERESLSLKIQQEESEKSKIQSLEYEKKIQDMQKALEDAQRKGNATSERFRGEVKELDMEDTLRGSFPYDEIKEVPKGILGADILQIVKDTVGREFGTIVWECKRTKSFNEDWITKLKDDVIRSGGNFAILVTQVLPEGIHSFDFRNGVWICDFTSYLQLALVLRMNLFEIKRVEKLSEGKDQKMGMLYEYLSSDQFKNKIIAVVESYKMMSEQLEREKRAFTKIWSEREMQIRRMTDGTLSVLGDMQGIMGNSLPKIDGLELLEE